MPRRWLLLGSVVLTLLAFAQAPGLISPDTKLDLTANPAGFLGRAAHQWDSLATFGQVQNQAYGYFFPHGAFFVLGHWLSLPAWITQRLWWSALLIAGFWGVVRVADALGIGSRTSRIVAAALFVLSPRVLTTLGSISSETAPMMLAPWVLLPVILALQRTRTGPDSPGPNAVAPKALWPNASMRQLAARSAAAVALMGAVNAVATGAACLVAALWWISHRPDRRWWRFTAWWVPSVLLACFWWLAALWMLGKVSPPFLDFIESAATTTRWTSLVEVLRGTDSWTPFVSPERIAGAALVTEPVMVLATGVVAAAGLAGLCMRRMPAKGRLTLILFVGVVGLAAGYAGELGSPIADTVRAFLDAGGAPLRNVHKLEPLVRLPLVLGIAHLIGRVPLPGSVPWRRSRSAFAHPEHEPMVAVTGLLMVAAVLATSVAWTGDLAPAGAYRAIPDYWKQAAGWLSEHARGTSPDGSGAERALVVPGAPFASQVWGMTRDEPLQPLATTPWAVRDAIPLTPPGAIRALDSVQQLLAAGTPSTGLATTLLGQGIDYLVVRNDLDPDNSRSARPIVVHNAIDGSPGLTKVAQFGDEIGAGEVKGLVADEGLRPKYPAIEIYRVGAAGRQVAGPYAVNLDSVPVVQGGPEVLQRLAERTGADHVGGPAVLAADLTGPAAADIGRSAIVTDTPTDREVDFGRVDGHSSAIRAPGDPRRTYNRAPDYPVPGAALVEGRWDGARVTVSSSAADATQLGAVSPGSSAAAAFDGNPATSWLSNGLQTAIGQWLKIDLDTPLTEGVLDLTTSAAALGTPVSLLEVSTNNGSATVRVSKPGEKVSVALPGGSTDWIKITAIGTENGTAGVQFGLSELTVRHDEQVVPIDHRVVLPPVPDGLTVRGWSLGQEFPGSPGCVNGPRMVQCSTALALGPETLSGFQRTLSVPAATAVVPRLYLRPRPGPALDALLAQPDRPQASGQSQVADSRGSAFAATDGDPHTSWTAPAKAADPTLTITLPRPELVTGLVLTPSIGTLPAHPTEVAVNLGDGPQVRKLTPDGKSDKPIALTPRVTDTIMLSLVDWDTVLGVNGLGFAERQAPGLAGVGVLTDGGTVPVAAPADPDRPIRIDCAHGPTLAVAGQFRRASITTTAAQLRSGAPIPATICDPDPVTLPAGRQDVNVSPGDAFLVDGVELPVATGASASGPETPQHLTTDGWSANRRVVDLPASNQRRLLVVPESTNPGWIAADAHGTRLDPIVVDGWQQGWIVPAGAATTVTLSYPSDTWYRWALFGGLALLVPLFLLAFVPALRRERRAAVHGPATRTWRSTGLGLVGVVASATVISGPVGVVVAVALSALTGWLTAVRSRSFAVRTLVVLAGTGMVVGTAILSTGPWRSRDGYLGHSMLVQFPALVALVAVGVSAVPLSRAVLRRLRPRRPDRDGEPFETDSL
ncbi:alpha-(1-_3)-arabinofuranosyltransferase [Speluncibacter jeojiensis]|uniref:Alpha-(1->3)-arabinofuranosyltransferase n=1 Tax=Speluncibacter jeojiensis TaxID=2710754 RepID=A0A9X4M2F6_9ACTN|nr:alpha-(1->3)-arabinofuranosyltransferase [Corynebacteriales bacterium D3-21]